MNNPLKGCMVCGDKYGPACRMQANGEMRFFDSFECAFYEVAPRCAHCSRRIVDHGIEVGGLFFCSAQCAHVYEPGRPQDGLEHPGPVRPPRPGSMLMGGAPG